MATTRVVSNLSGQAVLFITPKNEKGQLTSINIDNQGASSHTITIKDSFLPDVSAGVASPSQQLKTRFQVTLVKGDSFSADKNSLTDVQPLGTTYAEGDTLDSGCVIIAGYHFNGEPQ